MKKIALILANVLLLSGFVKNPDREKLVLIHVVARQIPGFAEKAKVAEINKSAIDKLDEPLKALAAYYSALAGSNCNGKYCELTSALGLGDQGSKAHIELIKKWFPNDKVADALVAQSCFQPSSGSSYFTNYNTLIFELEKDTVIIEFSITKYDHGKSSLQNGFNKAIIKSNEIVIIKR
jgi:hypothetical protein